MNESLLRQFYTDRHTRETVFEFIRQHAKELAAEYAFEGKSTDGFKQLAETLLDTERAMEEMFTVQKDTPSINPAK